MKTEEGNTTTFLGSYRAYKALEREFSQELGYFNRNEIPDGLVSKIARFCDDHPNDSMTSYYASALIGKFFRRKSKERWERLFHSMDSHLHTKRFLLKVFFGYHMSQSDQSFLAEPCRASAIWLAINDVDDGYEKANLITRFSPLFDEDIVPLAYKAALAMPEKYRTRALAGIYPNADKARKAEIFLFLCGELIRGSSEAAHQLTQLFPNVDTQSQSELITIYLSDQDLPEPYLANFVIRNAAYLSCEKAQGFIDRVREFRSNYLKNRCLLKLSGYLPAGELDSMYRRYMESFSTRPPSSELLHNLYQFSAALNDRDIGSVVDLALNKINTFDDSQNEIYSQDKYYELSFLVPHLQKRHMCKAFAIAESVRGGYRRNIISKLKRHFLQSTKSCSVL